MKSIFKYSLTIFLVYFTLFISCSEETTEQTNGGGTSYSEVEVFQGETSIESDAPAKVSFISSNVGNSVTKVFTVKNTGTTNLAVSNLTVSSGFGIVTFPKSSVASSQSTTFEIRFNASTVGEKIGKISFNTNDSNEGLFTINIVAETLVPSKAEIQLTESEVILINNPTQTLDFGNTPEKSVVVKTFTVKNIALNDNSTLNDNLTLSSLAVTPTSGFSIASNFGSTTLVPSESTTFQIQFDASTLGQSTGQLSFTTNDADEGSVKVNLVANTTANYFPSKVGNSWFYDRQYPALSTSTSQILSNELTESKNIFGKYINVTNINKNVYDYSLNGSFTIESIGSLSFDNLIFFNENDTVNEIYSYFYDFVPESIPSDKPIDLGKGTVLKDVVVTIRPKLFIDIKKLTGNENYTVNGTLYTNTQDTKWNISISSSATISGTLWSGPLELGPVNQTFTILPKTPIGYNQIRLARNIGPIETIQNIDLKDVTFIKKFNFFGYDYDATELITPIEDEFRLNNDLNYSKLKNASISY